MSLVPRLRHLAPFECPNVFSQGEKKNQLFPKRLPILPTPPRPSLTLSGDENTHFWFCASSPVESKLAEWRTFGCLTADFPLCVGQRGTHKAFGNRGCTLRLGESAAYPQPHRLQKNPAHLFTSPLSHFKSIPLTTHTAKRLVVVTK